MDTRATEEMSLRAAIGASRRLGVPAIVCLAASALPARRAPHRSDEVARGE